FHLHTVNLSVDRLPLIGIIPNGLYHFVNLIFGEPIRSGVEHTRDTDSLNIVIDALESTGRGKYLHIEGILLEKFFRIPRNKAHVHRGDQIGHDRSTRYLLQERRINDTVLQGGHHLYSAQQLLIDIVVSNAVIVKNVPGSSFVGATGSTDAYFLPSQI